MLFTPNFLPSVITFSKLIESDRIRLNESDVYFKQSYRNRACILTSSRTENLIVPVHASSGKTPIKEVRIDNGFPWQRTMLRTIQTAYRNSVYYTYYDYFFEPLFSKNYIFLTDLQEDSIQFCLRSLKLSKDIIWQKHDNISEIFDLSPKKTDVLAQLNTLKPYTHTFGNVFVPNLSVIDLIFCQGPQATDFLIKKQHSEQ
jgi:hypothetical protein